MVSSTGDLAPVADAGPDRTLTGPATVTLDAPALSIRTATRSRTSGGRRAVQRSRSRLHKARCNLLGAALSVHLHVDGAQSVSSPGLAHGDHYLAERTSTQILLFSASPSSIQTGQITSLVWQVTSTRRNSVTISAVGGVTQPEFSADRPDGEHCLHNHRDQGQPNRDGQHGRNRDACAYAAVAACHYRRSDQSFRKRLSDGMTQLYLRHQALRN